MPKIINTNLQVCYNNYDRTIEDKDEFYPSTIKYTSQDAWRYQTERELNGHDYTGLLATYRLDNAPSRLVRSL